MEDNDGNSQRFLWRFSPRMNNLGSLPEQVRNNRIQHHVGQVMRDVLPGNGPQPAYHPNPYLQHLYRHSSLEEGGGASRVENLQHSLDELEAQLHEVISQDVPASSSENSLANSPSTTNNNHGHTHRAGERTNLEQLDWKSILGSVSFIIILFLRLMVDHLLGVVLFGGLTAIFYYANIRMIEIVHITSLRERQTDKRIIITPLWLIFFLSINIFCIYGFFDDQQLWRVLYFHLPTDWQSTVFDLFWVTMITDHVVRFVTIMFKAMVAISPRFIFPQRKKGRYYMVIETLMQLYRTVLPIVPWLHFLYDQPKSGKLVFAAILVVAYIVLKAWTLFLEYLKLAKAVKTLRNDMTHGVQPTLEELQSCGEQSCPICQDDFQDPVMLSCKHIFCENCVSIWFDREKTCPMCRSQIHAESPIWQDGSTSSHLQWY